MDQKWKGIIIAMLMHVATKKIILSIRSAQQVALAHQFRLIATVLSLLELTQSLPRYSKRALWSFERNSLFMEQNLTTSYSASMFKRRWRVSKKLFEFLCTKLAPHLRRSDTNYRLDIPIESKVGACLSRLATGNSLLGIADLFGMSEASLSIQVREFCKAVKTELKGIYIQKPNPSDMKRMAEDFEQIHGIPFIMGVVDGSHIPFCAPTEDKSDYYNRKGFYSVLLQGVVDAKCLFWDYDFGHAGKNHDYYMFKQSALGQKCMRGEYIPYKLIGDVGYPARPWMYSPFHGSKGGLPPYMANWNYCQSSTRMAIERAFGILKGRWRILLKRVDIPLRHLPNLIHCCIILHNLCIVHGDSFDMEWITDVDKDADIISREEYAQLSHGDQILWNISTYGRREVDRLNLNDCGLNSRTQDESDGVLNLERSVEEEDWPITEAEDDSRLLQEATVFHHSIAHTLWKMKAQHDSAI